MPPPPLQEYKKCRLLSSESGGTGRTRRDARTTGLNSEKPLQRSLHAGQTLALEDKALELSRQETGKTTLMMRMADVPNAAE